MRMMLLASAAALAFAAFTPAQAMPLATGVSAQTQSQVTEVRARKHYRHHRARRHYMRRTYHNDLNTGLPGRGPARDMSKTNGGRANDR